MDGQDGVQELSSEKPEPEVEDVPPPAEEEPPPPPTPEEPPEPEQKPSEDVWKENYEEFVEVEEAPPPKRKKFRHWGAVITTLVIIIILVVWTLASPSVMDPVGDTYIGSDTYASWGNYTGSRDIWAGSVTWGLSISGHNTSAGNRSIELNVLLTKVHEKPGNWFFGGLGIELRNVSVFADDGTFLGSMTAKRDLGFGISATVPVTFPSTGVYELYVTAKFLEYEVMRIGYIPLEMVKVPPVYLDFPVAVT
jgi:hypothetical protein